MPVAMTRRKKGFLMSHRSIHNSAAAHNSNNTFLSLAARGR
jgi:hypothetical protein